jgi:hypothetical protein
MPAQFSVAHGRMMRWFSPRAALNATLVLTIAEIVFLVGTKQVTFGAAQGGWTYNYFGDLRPAPVLMAAGMSLAMVPLVHLSLRFIDRYQALVLALWVGVGTGASFFFTPFTYIRLKMSSAATRIPIMRSVFSIQPATC